MIEFKKLEYVPVQYWFVDNDVNLLFILVLKEFIKITLEFLKNGINRKMLSSAAGLSEL